LWIRRALKEREDGDLGVTEVTDIFGGFIFDEEVENTTSVL
jgi:hypothetical protein